MARKLPYGLVVYAETRMHHGVRASLKPGIVLVDVGQPHGVPELVQHDAVNVHVIARRRRLLGSRDEPGPSRGYGASRE